MQTRSALVGQSGCGAALCFFQIGGVEALGEPTVDGGEQIMSLGPPTLLAPQPSEARRRAQLIGRGALLPRDRQCLI